MPASFGSNTLLPLMPGATQATQACEESFYNTASRKNLLSEIKVTVEGTGSAERCRLGYSSLLPFLLCTVGIALRRFSV